MSPSHEIKSAQAVLLIKCGAYISEQREGSAEQVAAAMMRAYQQEVENYPRVLQAILQIPA
jgi:hypothetical protein